MEGKSNRCLDIGPGENPAEGFECLNVVPTSCTDYVLDATAPLPFADNSFVIVHASHVLEHIAWFDAERVVREWVRIVSPGGRLEIWVPDGYKLSREIVALNEGKDSEVWKDGWKVRGADKDPFLWLNGRIFYGARDDYPSWHKALYSQEHLRRLLGWAGLVDIRRLRDDELRGHNHGWINLGMTGTKP